MAGGFRELGAWRFGMELAVLVFDLTEKPREERTSETEEADDALRLAALEVPQRIAAGAADGRPRPWLQCLELARRGLDRLGGGAKLRWAAATQDPRLTSLVARVRSELDALQEASWRHASEAAAANVEVEPGLEEAA